MAVPSPQGGGPGTPASWTFQLVRGARGVRRRTAGRISLPGDCVGYRAPLSAAARGTRLPAEGSHLRFSAASWTELIGVASGYQLRPATRACPTMDRAWFENEAERIRTEGCGRAVGSSPLARPLRSSCSSAACQVPAGGAPSAGAGQRITRASSATSSLPRRRAARAWRRGVKHRRGRGRE